MTPARRTFWSVKVKVNANDQWEAKRNLLALIKSVVTDATLELEEVNHV